MEAAQGERTPAFLAGLPEPDFADTFMASRLGSTTHVSVLDADGWACSVTTTNGEGSGVVVPGTGVHVNNMMGEQDLSPLGWFTHPPGRRLPSMMAPTIVLADDGRPELVLGSAGSNRIRSAILQVIVNVLDRGMDAQEAVDAPRVHFEDGAVYAEPGVDTAGIDATIAWFRERNLFFGGCQAVEGRADDGRRRPAPGRRRRRRMTMVIAHRCNTLESVERAIALGVDMIEFDVRRTRAGELVAHHDPLSGRTREQLGSPPLVEEIVELVAGRVPLDVELKEDGYVEDVLKLVRGDELIVKSFIDAVVAQAASRACAPRCCSASGARATRCARASRSCSRSDGRVRAARTSSRRRSGSRGCRCCAAPRPPASPRWSGRSTTTRGSARCWATSASRA